MAQNESIDVDEAGDEAAVAAAVADKPYEDSRLPRPPLGVFAVVVVLLAPPPMPGNEDRVDIEGGSDEKDADECLPCELM